MIDPEHLLQLADELSSPPRRGRPRQARLRRAVSSAYYAVFHDLCTQATDLLVGAAERQTKRYKLVYRSFDHREIRAACLQSAQSNDFGSALKTCGALFVELQAARGEADYNPSTYFTTLDVQSSIEKARQLIFALELADAEERKLFLTGFKFKQRT
jgi:uncharacterized protein (UPF0332 family)